MTEVETPIAGDRILRAQQVCEIAQLNRTTINRLIANGAFPKPVKMGERAIGWRHSDIQRWISELSPA